MMRLMLGTAFAAVALVTSAMAQTPATPPAGATTEAPAAAAAATPPTVPPSRCPAFPADPTLPDGASARNQRAMTQGDATYQTWGRAMQASLECRRAEVEELQPAMRQGAARVAEYNEGATKLNTVGQQWQASAAAYNSRNGRR